MHVAIDGPELSVKISALEHADLAKPDAVLQTASPLNERAWFEVLGFDPSTPPDDLGQLIQSLAPQRTLTVAASMCRVLVATDRGVRFYVPRTKLTRVGRSETHVPLSSVHALGADRMYDGYVQRAFPQGGTHLILEAMTEGAAVAIGTTRQELLRTEQT